MDVAEIARFVRDFRYFFRLFFSYIDISREKATKLRPSARGCLIIGMRDAFVIWISGGLAIPEFGILPVRRQTKLIEIQKRLIFSRYSPVLVTIISDFYGKLK